ncbi:hypothetical protein RFI_05493 [Reticulomyxa filosa]|uniref:Uncharacterized protein n=1 Tax=Reticulomyxa filosa TaxID=46433 RepID=X6P0G6_RETFI|nr:hypothetical protein RFI_05493 [Reticulomyxa filosa]|eukprot:ETO31628.1 hypothetical protein RFI_05493 [Reticulomyxa filosa]
MNGFYYTRRKTLGDYLNKQIFLLFFTKNDKTENKTEQVANLIVEKGFDFNLFKELRVHSKNVKMEADNCNLKYGTLHQEKKIKTFERNLNLKNGVMLLPDRNIVDNFKGSALHCVKFSSNSKYIVLLGVIKIACNPGNWTIQHRTRFVYDLLCVVQHMEDWDNDTCQANFRYTLKTIFGTMDKLINPATQLSSSSYSFSFLKNCLMFQSLERLLQNKWKLPEIKLQHDESVILNRVYERLYFNSDITSKENEFEQRIHTDNDRIRAISKWKVQLYSKLAFQFAFQHKEDNVFLVKLQRHKP